MLIQSIGCCCRVMKTSNGDTVSLASFEGEREWHVVLVPLQYPPCTSRDVAGAVCYAVAGMQLSCARDVAGA
jgi:hypothetical protein